VAGFVTTVFGNYTEYGGWYNLVAVLLYCVQLYADFSGGIDIVIGTAEIFGIRMDENFRQPFFSKSIGEFWRRWHITLGTWMKDYIFYPFSLSKQMNRFGKWSKKHLGNTVGKAMPICLADLLIFFVVGIWHGAAWKYIAYGMYNGIIIAVSSLLEPLYAKGFEKTKIHKESKAWTVVQIIRTFILVNIGWYFDMAVSFSAALVMMKETFTKMSMSQFTGTAFLELGMGRRDFLIVLAGCIIIFIVSLLKERGVAVREAIAAKPLIVRWAVWYAFIVIIFIFAYTGDGSAFIYANF
jgi:D-alanyl-lipoteichoic acid acyltransferase DltB (MBOAT superfamily)